MSKLASAILPGSQSKLPGLHKNGREISLELSFGEFESEGDKYFTGIARDITKRKRDEHRLALQHAVTAILAEAPSMNEAAPRLLTTIARHLEWQIAALWQVDAEENKLHLVCDWRDPALAIVAEFAESRAASRFSPAQGFPGQVWAENKPIWVSDIGVDGDPRFAAAAGEHLHSAFGFPILVRKEVFGVVELLSNQAKETDPETLDTLAAVGSQVGQFIERKNTEAERSCRPRARPRSSAGGGSAHAPLIGSADGDRCRARASFSGRSYFRIAAANP